MLHWFVGGDLSADGEFKGSYHWCGGVFVNVCGFGCDFVFVRHGGGGDGATAFQARYRRRLERPCSEDQARPQGDHGGAAPACP